MKLLTLTPEFHVYTMAILIVYSLSCASLADFLITWGRSSRRKIFLSLYVATMAVVAGFAVLILDLPNLTRTSWPLFGISIPMGIMAGTLAWMSEVALKRYLRQREVHKARRARAPGPWQSGESPAMYVQSWMRPGYGPSRLVRTDAEATITQSDNSGLFEKLQGPAAQRYAVLALLLLAAVLEEALFRGVLVGLALSLSAPLLVVLCLIATAIMFALAHVRLGANEVIAKLPLSLLALIVVLLVRSVWPAVIAHVVFNLRAWQAMVKLGPERKQPW